MVHAHPALRSVAYGACPPRPLHWWPMGSYLHCMRVWWLPSSQPPPPSLQTPPFSPCSPTSQAPQWRYGDSQVLYLTAILDPRYKMLDFQFSPAQFSQAEQALSRLVTVDDSQADQPVAMALEQLRRGWGAPTPTNYVKRSSLLLGRMWLLAFIYFNKRVLERRPKPQPEAEWQQFAQWMQHMPVEA
ncbi:hypothetical protein QJQ45_028724 [Haematococcus lacustris]|nr:hypothetical protein QJQ45_028724 [Haematococcus lacustris]